MQYATAYGALVYLGKVADRDFVIIPAASSSVGLAAIQIAKAEGAIAIATTRTGGKRAELLQLGADFVIATGEEDLPAKVKDITAGKGARLVFDPVGGPFVETLIKATAEEGIVFEYGMLSGQPTPFPLRESMSRGISLRGYTLHELVKHPERLEQTKRYIYERLEDGRFKPRVDRTFPLAQVQEAYRYLESNQQIGKIVITVP